MVNIIATAILFSTNINTTYTLTQSPNVDVSETISITNQSDTKFATAYELLIPSKIKTVKVTNGSGGLVRSNIENLGEGTKIKLTFPNPIVGIGKTQSYSLEYQNPNIAIQGSNIIQAVIPPPVQNNPDTTRITHIIISKENCPNFFSTPNPTKKTEDDNIVSATYENISDKPIFVRCANTRYVATKLAYTLSNENMTPIETQITLPPDTDFQQVFFDSIEPKPINLTTDSDGNHIASYKLEPKETKSINVATRIIFDRTNTSPNHDSNRKMSGLIGNTPITWTEYTEFPDLNHLVLSINSQSGPIPSVIQEDISPFSPPKATVKAELIHSIFNQTKFIITNQSNFSLYRQSLKIFSGDQMVFENLIDRLPMQNQVIIPFNLSTNDDNLSITLNDQPIELKKTNQSPSTIAISGILASIASVIAVSTGSLLVLRRSK